MNYAFRLYATSGCPHCAAAEDYFVSRNMPIQIVVIDPLIAKGIPMALNQREIETPIVMSFLTQEIIQGYRPNDYDRIIQNYRTRFGAELSNEDSNGGNYSGKAPFFPEETERLSVGTF